MRVLLLAYGSRWGIEPLAGLAVRLRALVAADMRRFTARPVTEDTRPRSEGRDILRRPW